MSTSCTLNFIPASNIVSRLARSRVTFPQWRLTNERKVGDGMRSLTAAQLIQPPPVTGKGSVESGQVRVRQHVNPLARRWSQPVNLPMGWYETAFADAFLPLVVDLGVAKGRFLYKLACREQKCNFLGLEIREPLVHQANRVAADAGLRNLFYVACNANVSFASVMDGVPNGVLRDVYVQFCDPWFKKRHAKRRMLNSPLVADIFNALSASSSCSSAMRRGLFIQSDVLEVAQEMRDYIEEHGGFSRVDSIGGVEEDDDGWLLENPLGVPTEREIAVENKNGRVYRALFQLSKATRENSVENN